MIVRIGILKRSWRNENVRSLEELESEFGSSEEKKKGRCGIKEDR
jgi:hypothetical protein